MSLTISPSTLGTAPRVAADTSFQNNTTNEQVRASSQANSADGILRTGTEIALGWLGASAGGDLGAQTGEVVGAVLGTAMAPGAGTLVGGALGGVVGGLMGAVGGGIAGAKFGGSIADHALGALG